MTGTAEIGHDPALEVLNELSATVRRSVGDLQAVDSELGTIRRRRTRGWTWRQIMESPDTKNPLSMLAAVTSALARAGGEFRRALAKALRRDGMLITQIAELFEVSRQRVSALVRSRE